MRTGGVWLATDAMRRYPALDEDIEVDLAVVGGGWTGLTTALLAQRDGARMRPIRAYGLAGRLRGPAPQSMTISVDSPSYSTRPWLAGGPGGLIVVGNSHETGASDVDTGRMYGELEDWTRETFDVESIDHRWSAQDFVPADEVPYVGRAPLHELVWVATGFKKWGLSNGTAAAMILSDLLSGRDNAWLPVVDASRIGDAQAVAQLIKDNLKVGKEFVGGRFDQPIGPAEELPAGSGGIAELDGSRVGAYRDASGRLHAVKLTCTHLGCPLHWNAAETSWDGNCHGSRFDVDGAILNGPAVTRSTRSAPTSPDDGHRHHAERAGRPLSRRSRTGRTSTRSRRGSSTPRLSRPRCLRGGRRPR